jgi:hypothetical protein
MKEGKEDRGFDAAVDTESLCSRVGDVADWAGE